MKIISFYTILLFLHNNLINNNFLKIKFKQSSECLFRGVFYQNKCFCQVLYEGERCQTEKSHAYFLSENKCENIINRLDHLQNINLDHQSFDDDEFPRLSGDSIGQIKNQQQQSQRIQNNWIQMHEITKNFQIFGDKISFKDIQQGNLGNCYLIAALASLANIRNGEIIKNIFQTKSDNKNHTYVTKWFINGRPIFVAVDDWIPGKNKIPFFLRSFKKNQFWGIILEKSWAKIHGEYMITQSGQQTMVWESLTQARTYSISHKKTDAGWIFDHVRLLLDKEFPVGAGTLQPLKHKLLQKHAYSIIDAYEIQLKNGQKEELIKIFNPYNKEFWLDNPWGDLSNIWNQVITQGINHDPNDGVFHLSSDDYLNQFGFTNWAELYKEYDIYCQDIPLSKSEQKYQIYFKLEQIVQKPFYVFIEFISPRLLQKENCKQPFEYKKNSFKILSPDQKKIKGKDKNKPQILITDPSNGIYIAKVDIKLKQFYHKYFTLNIYAPKESVQFLNDQIKIKEIQGNCANNCSKHGKCNTFNNQCICYHGFFGNDCSKRFYLQCPNNCNNQGYCDQNIGQCICNQGFTGKDCQVCKDFKKNCKELAQDGYCNMSSPYEQIMQQYCQLSCGQAGYERFSQCQINIKQKNQCDGLNCGKNGKCIDGYCKCETGYFGLFCQKKREKECLDNIGLQCVLKFKKEDCFSQWKDFMQINCQRFCGICQI